MKRAPHGSLKAFLASLQLGDSFTDPNWNHRRTVYCTAKRAGIKIRINQIGERKAYGRYGFIATITG